MSIKSPNQIIWMHKYVCPMVSMLNAHWPHLLKGFSCCCDIIVWQISSRKKGFILAQEFKSIVLYDRKLKATEVWSSGYTVCIMRKQNMKNACWGWTIFLHLTSKDSLPREWRHPPWTGISLSFSPIRIMPHEYAQGPVLQLILDSVKLVRLNSTGLVASWWALT